MNEDAFTDQLNDFLDGGLSPSERRRVEKHLGQCEDCSALLASLRALREDAAELESPAPPDEIWGRISAALGGEVSEPAGRVHGGGLRIYLALAAVVVLAVSIFLLERPGPGNAPPHELVSMVTAELQAAESHYDNAIEGLEIIVAQNDGVLNEELNLVLDTNLDLIEQAIAESRAAIREDPDSTVAQESLLEALRRKVSLLQSTILLINEIRKGEGENALELIDDMREQTPRNPM